MRPTVLIGTSGQPGMFTEEVVRAMARHVERPAIFPLSNPTSRSEATPADLLAWTDGRALVATGSPFADVAHDGRTFRIAQCNNAYIFPGLGQGVIASGARRVTDAMFLAAARALGDASPARTDPDARACFPPLEEIVPVSRRIALAVGARGPAPGPGRADHARGPRPPHRRRAVGAALSPAAATTLSRPTREAHQNRGSASRPWASARLGQAVMAGSWDRPGRSTRPFISSSGQNHSGRESASARCSSRS